MADIKMTDMVVESTTRYAGAVLQSRALVDVRDCLKPSARQIFYCLYTDKFIHKKPFKKTLKGIGSAMRMYIHGDSSVEGIIMRMGQPFSLRYPLIEVEGSYGNLMESGNWAAPRYTSSRLSDLSNYLFKDIAKDTIEDWRDNYDDTEQYPSVLPSKGFYGICLGTMGIGVGAACSIPPFNLREVNTALIKLLDNPDIDDKEILCLPDFPTGGILLNQDEVKDSLLDGFGKSCKIRSVVEYDEKEKCFIVKEIPFGVYTNTICKQLEEMINSEKDLGIIRFNDLTAENPNIKIYLSKKANPTKVLKLLYKETSLQSYFGINFTMLKDGRFPQVFSWREALQEYLTHERIVYEKAIKFDLNKIKLRLHIIEGVLIALARIEEVIEVIKKSNSTKEANINLQNNFELDEIQAEAILKITLARLSHLEVQKFENEKKSLLEEADKLQAILDDEELLKNEIKKDLQEVMKKFGDDRKTKILNLQTEEDEVKEEYSLFVNLSNKNNIYVVKESSLFTQSRGGVGQKIKLDKDEYFISSASGQNLDVGLFFSNQGNFFHKSLYDLPLEELIPLESLFKIETGESICELMIYEKSLNKNILIFTKNGMIKKSLISTYNITKNVGMKAIALAEDDEIVSVLSMAEEEVGLLTAQGQFVMCKTDNINAIGRVTKGVKGIKLNENDYLVSTKVIPKDFKEIITISENGLSKRTDASEFSITGRNTKGSKVQKLVDENDRIVDFVSIIAEKEVLVVANSSQLKLKISEISLSSKGSQGSKSIKIPTKKKVISLIKF